MNRPLTNPSPVTRQAFALDALALASWAEELGFDDDAETMRAFALKVLPARLGERKGRSA